MTWQQLLNALAPSTSEPSSRLLDADAPLFEPTPMGKPGPEAGLFRVAACLDRMDRCELLGADQANIDATADAE